MARMSLLARTTALGLAVLSAAGCKPFTPPARSPLQTAQLTPQSMVLEIFFARVPLGDPQANTALWTEVDEQRFPTDLRWRLTRNGFRLGAIVGQLPAPLAQILEIKDAPPPSVDDMQNKPAKLAGDDKVLRQHLQIRAGQRSEIVASDVYPELPVLLCEGEQVCGQTYFDAQGVLAIRVFPEPDGRVRLELTPELQYGPMRQHWSGQQGIMRLDTGRERRVFDSMAVSTLLAPGEMLVMTGLPNRSGSLGHQFFTENKTGHQKQKLLVIRLAQTQHDDLVGSSQELPLEDH